MNSEIAVLMAAGLGSRMLPITERTPKPLISVKGTPLIETVIQGLCKRGVSTIYVVVGYLKEQFSYLPEKYENVIIVENTEYQVKNNISSIYAVKDVIGKNNCFICEADLYLSDDSILQTAKMPSCYFGRMVKGYSDDWVFQQENDRIVGVGKGGTDLYNMVGIAYFQQSDIEIIGKAVESAYETPGHEELFWDEIVDQQLPNLNLQVFPIHRNQMIELDTVEELIAFDPSCSSLLDR